MDRLYNVSPSPHVRGKLASADIMRDVVIAMLPATVFAVYQFGIKSLLIIILTVLSCVGSEYAFEKIMKKPITVSDFSAVVTGMILALNMPPEVPLWIPVIGGIFAIIVVKQMYGGLGQNWMNPALAARCFLLISFAGAMTNFSSAAMGYDSLSMATPMAVLKSNFISSEAAAQQSFNALYSIKDLFLGTIPGTIGEVSKSALLLGALYLLYKGIINIRIPLTYILTVAVFVFIFGERDIDFVLAHVLGGGLIFGAFFMATDYATVPITPKGQVVFAMFIGLLTGLFRLFGGSAEGVSYAIIIGNIMVPLIEKYTLPRAFGRGRK